MIHEFAVDPRVMGDHELFKILRRDLGYSKGRVISMMPKRWRKQVFDELLKEKSDIKKTRVREYIQKRKDQFLVKNGRMPPNIDGMTWEELACSMADVEPFRAIISKETKDLTKGIIKLEYDSIDKKPFHVRTQKTIPRTPKSHIECGRILYRESSEFRIIDPYFRPNANNQIKEGFIETFRELLKFKQDTKTQIKRIDIHTVPELSRDNKNEAFQDFDPNNHLKAWEEVEQFVPAITDRETNQRTIVPFTVHYRSAIRGGNPHARHILTEKGGIKYDYGFDTGDGETEVYLIEDDMFEQLKKDYSNDYQSGQVKSIKID